MNAKNLIAAVAIIAATGFVFAQSQESVAPYVNFVSTKMHTQVVAERNRAYAQDTLAIRDGVDAVIVSRYLPLPCGRAC